MGSDKRIYNFINLSLVFYTDLFSRCKWLLKLMKPDKMGAIFVIYNVETEIPI